MSETAWCFLTGLTGSLKSTQWALLTNQASSEAIRMIRTAICAYWKQASKFRSWKCSWSFSLGSDLICSPGNMWSCKKPQGALVRQSCRSLRIKISRDCQANLTEIGNPWDNLKKFYLRSPSDTSLLSSGRGSENLKWNLKGVYAIPILFFMRLKYIARYGLPSLETSDATYDK